MKSKFKLLVILFVTTIFFISCGKEPQIIGKWKLAKITFENQMMATMMEEYTQQAEGEVFEFNADGTVTAEVTETDDVEVDGSLRYALDGNNITFTLDLDDLPIDSTMTQEEIEIIQQLLQFELKGTYELPSKSKLKLRLGFLLPNNQMQLNEIKFTIDADRL